MLINALILEGMIAICETSGIYKPGYITAKTVSAIRMRKVRPNFSRRAPTCIPIYPGKKIILSAVGRFLYCSFITTASSIIGKRFESREMQSHAKNE